MYSSWARLVRPVIVILLMSMTVLAVALPKSVKADSSSPLDGIGQGPCSSAAPVINCSTQLLTTTQSNDVVIVVAEGTNSTTVSDSSGLSFVQRVSYSSTTYPPLTMVEFYAVAASPLNNDNITVSDAPRYTNGMQAFAIHGADTATLFDQDPSIPATVSCPGPDCGNCYADYNTNPGTCSASIQTSASDFVVATTAISDALPCGGYPTSPAGYVPPPGFTHILASDTFEVDYTLSANPPNSVEFDCNGTDAAAIALDAIAESPSSHAPIFINGNDEFTSDNGVTGGTGTSEDPYVISGWNIQAQDYGIEIANTTAYFTITNVNICSTFQPDCLNGIILSSIQNGVVQNSQISAGKYGIRVDNSENFQLTGNNLYQQAGGMHGIVILNSISFDVSNNSIEAGPFTIEGSYVSDASIVGNTGGAEDGIILDHLSGFLFSQNSIRAHVPIGVDSCGDLTIANNNLASPDTGIIVSNCDHVLVSNNTVSNIDGSGIWLIGADDINITSNTVSHNMNGIRLSNFATGNSITDNVISNDQCGIQTDSSSSVDQNYIADNTLSGNSQDYCSL